jgi:Tfp pilus assembly protein PilO
VGRFTEKQMILATIAVVVLLTAGFGALIWMDWQAIHKAEITTDDASAADVTDPEQWGENRKIYEIQREMQTAQAEADLIAKREQDVIVYREIVHRDAAILPEVDDVNNLARTINDYQDQSGVVLRQVSDLSINPGGETIKTMPIKLALSGTFDQFLKFLNLFENHDRIINVRAFSMASGRPTGQGRERRAVHDIQLDLVTYIYTPSAGLAKPVDIANYDRRKDDPVIQKLVRQQKAAHVDKYQLKPRINRRDPLIDPRRPSGTDPGAGDPADVQKQRELVDKLKFEIEVLKEDVRQEAQFAQDHKYVPLITLTPMIDDKCGKLEGEVMAADPVITVPELKEAFHDDVVAPFESIKSQRKSLPHVVLFSRKQAEEWLDKMKTSMEGQKYELVVKGLTDFETFLKGQTLAEDAADVVVEMRSLAKNAQGMIDFLALRVKVSGTIIRPDNGSIVILNNKSRKVGDTIDAAGRCRLTQIHEDKLVFELDGLEIEFDTSKK